MTASTQSIKSKSSSPVVKSEHRFGQRAVWVQRGAWILSMGGLLLGWEWLARGLPQAILPSPGETLSALGWLLNRESFYPHLRLTILRSTAGFLFSMSVGSFVGLLMGRYKTLGRLLNPLVILSTTVPPVFWVAIMIIWMGLGSGPPILVIIITATPLVAVNIAQGVRGIPAYLIEMADTFRVGRWTRLRELYLPALSGHLFSAALIAVRFSWRTVVMAEFIGSSDGLGNRLAWARQNLEMDLAFAYMLIMVAFGVLIEHGVLRPAKKRWGWEAGEKKHVTCRSI